jgi:hypothetical protein
MRLLALSLDLLTPLQLLHLHLHLPQSRPLLAPGGVELAPDRFWPLNLTLTRWRMMTRSQC